MLRLVALLTPFAAASIVDCSAPTAPFKISRLALRPDPPTPGLPVALDLEFTNTGPEITLTNAGSAATTVSVNGLPFSDSKPLCDNTACPIVAGFNNRTSESTWPDVTGKVVSTIRWTDAAAAELLCIQTSVRVGGAALRGADRTATLMLPAPLPFLARHQGWADHSSLLEGSPLVGDVGSGAAPTPTRHTHDTMDNSTTCPLQPEPASE